MRVRAHCQRDLRVSERLHDNARVHVLREQETRAGMPQVVVPDCRQPTIVQQPLENASDVGIVERCTVSRGKDVAAINPLVTGDETLLKLSDAVLSKLLCHCVRQRDRAT